MIYVFGVCGFILGFAAGLYVIHLFLKDQKPHDFLKNRSVRWTYGLSVWVFAVLGAWAGVWLYNRSFF